jgi:NitT/TauT family transport system ATP-binding protein
MTPILSFQNVSRTFEVGGGSFLAVQDVNLDVQPGEFVAIVGPSGCGKSTLLNMTAGILNPTTGTVRYAGEPIADLNEHVGYMTQNDHLLPWRDVRANIALPLEIRGEPRREVDETVDRLIALVGLGGFEKSYPSGLSGGMRKRTALARLLAYNPDTLLMDEPFAALDAQLRLRMQTELRRLSRQLGKTVLFVTHDLDEAVALADRCAVFTARPGTIQEVVTVPLDPDRDITKLRHDPVYTEMTAKLWDTMMASGSFDN